MNEDLLEAIPRMTWKEKTPGYRWIKTPTGKARWPRAELWLEDDGSYFLQVEAWPREKAPKGHVWRWRVTLESFGQVEDEVERCLRRSAYWRYL